MIFLDTETCGLHGPIVIIQYAIGVDGTVTIYNPWYHTVQETIDLFEMIANHKEGICAFNLAFDWFHIYQMWTVLRLISNKESLLIDCIDEYAELEPRGRDGPCLKPVKCLDLMVVARKGPYQSTMDRGDIKIRRVPSVLAWQLAKHLDQAITLDSILFAKRKDKTAPKWHVYDVEESPGQVSKNFKNVVLRFHPSSALKALVADALDVKEDSILLFRNISVDKKHNPVEFGYAPFAKAVGNRLKWNGAWPEKIAYHITHWEHDKIAREYAAKDVSYLQKLWVKFGCPEPGSDDDELTACVACVRHRGYKIDIESIKALKKKSKK